MIYAYLFFFNGESQFTYGLFVKFLPYPVVAALPVLPQNVAGVDIGSMA